MFRAVNTESESQQRKIKLERTKILSLYLSALKTLKVEKYFELKVRYEQNQGFYTAGKCNLCFSLVRKTPFEKIDELIEKFCILESKHAFFEYVKKCIENNAFLKAKKLLNTARFKGWWCNDLFDLEKLIKLKYFEGEVVNKKPKFEDFI